GRAPNGSSVRNQQLNFETDPRKRPTARSPLAGRERIRHRIVHLVRVFPQSRYSEIPAPQSRRFAHERLLAPCENNIPGLVRRDGRSPLTNKRRRRQASAQAPLSIILGPEPLDSLRQRDALQGADD